MQVSTQPSETSRKGGKRAWYLEVGTCAHTPRLRHPGEQQTWQICHWLPGLFTDDSRFTLSTRERVWKLCGEYFGACYSFQWARFGDGLLRTRHIFGELHGSLTCQSGKRSSDLWLVQWVLSSFCPMMWLEG